MKLKNSEESKWGIAFSYKFNNLFHMTNRKIHIFIQQEHSLIYIWDIELSCSLNKHIHKDTYSQHIFDLLESSH